jgi:hypothetical protein
MVGTSEKMVGKTQGKNLTENQVRVFEAVARGTLLSMMKDNPDVIYDLSQEFVKWDEENKPINEYPDLIKEFANNNIKSEKVKKALIDLANFARHEPETLIVVFKKELLSFLLAKIHEDEDKDSKGELGKIRG